MVDVVFFFFCFGSLLTVGYNFISQEGNLVRGGRNVLKAFHSKFYPHFAGNIKNSPQQKDDLSQQPGYGASRNAFPCSSMYLPKSRVTPRQKKE